MRKLKNILLISILLLYLVIISSTISDTRKQVHCNGINIEIKDKSITGFLSAAEVNEIISSRKNVIGMSLKDINLKEIEQILMQFPAIKSAQCYLTEDGKLNVLVTHREPVVRIFNHNQKGYYLDSEGYIFPLSKHFSPDILIANGSIYEPFDIKKTKSIYEVNPDSVSLSRRTLYDLLTLVNYIDQSDLWRAQIEQIYVTPTYEFELIPRVGANIIQFGRLTDYEEKFDNLRTLYLEGFNKSGWNDYLFINLKFKNQIICTKR